MQNAEMHDMQEPEPEHGRHLMDCRCIQPCHRRVVKSKVRKFRSNTFCRCTQGRGKKSADPTGEDEAGAWLESNPGPLGSIVVVGC